jgi:predicted RNA-binding protein with PIN domain
MRYLVDGYNLAFALGLLPGRTVTPYQLERARLHLVEHVRRHTPADSPAITVVFDAGKAPENANPRQVLLGVVVLFAVGSTADDRIEELIRHDPDPQRLTVVSDDRRLKEAARRRGCVALGCLDFLDGPRTARAEPPAPGGEGPPVTEPAKPEARPEDTQRWLDAFGEIDRDPRYGEGWPG